MGRKRSYISGLSRLLADYPQPVYAFDADRIVVYCNAACLEWTDTAVDEMIGQRCTYHSNRHDDGTPDRLAGLCPPPEVFLGRPISAEVACPDANGHWSGRQAECLPLPDSHGACQGVMVIVSPDGLARAEPSADSNPSVGELHEQLRSLLLEDDPPSPIGQIIGQSPAILRIRRQTQIAARSDGNVLIYGPPGSGRETIARSIHYTAGATSVPLMPLACYLLDAELLESTVSAFAAACVELEADRPAALLLLEVDQLDDDAQSVLASTLDAGERKLRTIATSRTSLIELANEGAYRHDLAYALSTLTIQIPPLADRTEDVPLLAQYFLERGNAPRERQYSRFSDEALDQLTAYPWPENIDELAELVQQACAAAAETVVQAVDLPEKIRITATAEAYPARPDSPVVLDDFLAEIERELIVRAVRQAKGNKALAARLLGLSRARLSRRLEHFGI